MVDERILEDRRMLQDWKVEDDGWKRIDGRWKDVHWKLEGSDTLEEGGWKVLSLEGNGRRAPFFPLFTVSAVEASGVLRAQGVGPRGRRCTSAPSFGVLLLLCATASGA